MATKKLNPNLKQKKYARGEALNLISDFLGDTKPYAISYVNQFDLAYFYKLTPQEKSPFFWIPIDIASIIFSLNIDPAIMSKSNIELYERLGIDHEKFEKHNALDDAKLLREVYLKLVNQS